MATINSINSNIPIEVAKGGTGQSTLLIHGILVGNTVAGITSLGVGATNTVLLGNTGADPSFGTVPNAALTNSSVTLSSGNNITVTGGGPLALGGTATIAVTGTTDHTVQVGNATGSLTSLTAGTNGQVLLGSTGANPAFITPTAGTGLGITSNSTTLEYALSTPVSIANGGTNATSMSTNTGIVKFDGTRLITSSTATIDASNIYTNTSQPAFVATNSTQSNITGDGTIYTVIFDGILTNVGSNFSSVTGIFTAPKTGLYHFDASISMSGIGVGHTSMIVNIILNGATSIGEFRLNPAVIAVSGVLVVSLSASISAAATNTIRIFVTVSGSTKTINIPNAPASFFSGYLVT